MSEPARKNRVFNGMDIPSFTPGSSKPTAFSASTMNIFSDVLRALVNPTITDGKKSEIIITDSNFIFRIKGLGGFGGGAGGSGMNWKGQYDSTTGYVPGDCVFTGTWPNVRNVFVALIKSGPPDAAMWPDASGPETYWQWVSSMPGCYRFHTFQTQYLTCRAFDYTTNVETGGDVLIALPYKLREGTQNVTVDGDSLTFDSYDATGQSRIATGTNGTETEVITPRYVTGDVLFAEQVKHSGIAAAKGLIDKNIDGRAWARQYGQG